MCNGPTFQAYAFDPFLGRNTRLVSLCSAGPVEQTWEYVFRRLYANLHKALEETQSENGYLVRAG